MEKPSSHITVSKVASVARAADKIKKKNQKKHVKSVSINEKDQQQQQKSKKSPRKKGLTLQLTSDNSSISTTTSIITTDTSSYSFLNSEVDHACINQKKIEVVLDNPTKDATEWNDGPTDLAKTTKTMKKIGRGAGGIVYLSYYRPLLRLLAVKEVMVHEEEERQLIKNELHALHENLVPILSPSKSNSTSSTKKQNSNNRALKWLFHHHENIGTTHPCEYIVSFYGAFSGTTKPTISIVMEYMNAGCLQVCLHITLAL